MMEELSKYILSVIAAALIIGILGDLTGKSSGTASMIRLVGGLFLVFTIIAPVARLDFSGLMDYFRDFSLEGEAASADGEANAEEVYRSIIKSEVEAYILDKADALQTELTVDVTLSDEEDPVPVIARLQGDISPYAKSQMQLMMEEDLGIAKENQVWIG